MLHKNSDGLYDHKHEDILVGLNFLTFYLRRRHLNAQTHINVFKTKLVPRLLWIILDCKYSLGLSETTLIPL
jgi:hypothetical protein